MQAFRGLASCVWDDAPLPLGIGWKLLKLQTERERDVNMNVRMGDFYVMSPFLTW